MIDTALDNIVSKFGDYNLIGGLEKKSIVTCEYFARKIHFCMKNSSNAVFLPKSALRM